MVFLWCCIIFHGEEFLRLLKVSVYMIQVKIMLLQHYPGYLSHAATQVTTHAATQVTTHAATQVTTHAATQVTTHAATLPHRSCCNMPHRLPLSCCNIATQVTTHAATLQHRSRLLCCTQVMVLNQWSDDM